MLNLACISKSLVQHSSRDKPERRIVSLLSSEMNSVDLIFLTIEQFLQFLFTMKVYMLKNVMKGETDLGSDYCELLIHAS